MVASACAVAGVALGLLAAPVPGGALIAGLMLLVGGVLPLWILGGTKYTISAPMLIVQSGPFRWQIPIAEITRIEPTRNPLSSPALSLDRLRITYGRSKACMVSPRDKDAFITELRRNGASGA